jgi:HSP20 family molecular chaperone IbpA
MIYVLGERPYYHSSLLDSSLLDHVEDSLWQRALRAMASYHPRAKSGTLLDDLMPTACLSGLAESIYSRHSSICVRDEKTEYVVEAPTPGVKKEDIKVEIVGRRRVEVTVEQAGEGNLGNEDGGETVKLAQRLFESVTLPAYADTSDGKVEYVDGMVRIRFAKLQDSDQEDEKLLQIVDAEHASLAKDLAARFENIQHLRTQLEKEVRETIQAEALLKHSRAEAVKEIARERKALAVI